ncbi:hypothetical protein [Galbibacter mesophilus]|nr:hypothetical protein [Galbibacter mesophilus]
MHHSLVEVGLVFKAEDYVYKSVMDYGEEKGLLENVIKFEYYG